MNSSHILALLKWDDDVISKNSKIRRFGLSGSLLQYTVFEFHPNCRNGILKFFANLKLTCLATLFDYKL